MSLYIPLDNERVYFHNYHHREIDPRIQGARPAFFDVWMYSDAEWYLTIAEQWYSQEKAEDPGYMSTYRDVEWTTAFFPLWPAVIRVVSEIFQIPLKVSAFISAHILSIFAFYFFYQLVFLYFKDRDIAFRSLVLITIFPFSVFYNLFYSESLFLLLSVLVFYFLKKDQPKHALSTSILAGLTRAVGVVTAVPIFFYYYGQFQRAKNSGELKARSYYTLLLSAAPFLGVGILSV